MANFLFVAARVALLNAMFWAVVERALGALGVARVLVYLRVVVCSVETAAAGGEEKKCPVSCP